MTGDAATGQGRERGESMADTELLRRYANERAEDAFAELVRRHIDFVYAAALRQARGNTALAQDVTQAVFLDMAQKATALARHAVLVGWLHTATRFATAKAIRAECRRHAREKQAHLMNERLRGNEFAPPIDWRDVQPVLDDALAGLKERDRSAVLLRFFEKKRFSEIGATLALTETAARSCVDRAVEKLRAQLVRRGVTSTSAAFAAALASQPIVAAPATLGTVITSAALANSAAAATSGGLAIVLEAFFTMSKIKIAAATSVVVLGTTVAVRELQATRTLGDQIRNVRGNQQALAQLRADNERLAAALSENARTNPAAAELARLSGRIAQLNARPEGVVDADMKPLTALRNAGRDTPVAAMETQLWARAVGDADAFAEFFGFTARTTARLHAFFAALPEHVRVNYGSPEKMLAPMAATWGRKGPPVAVQILGQTEHGPKVIVHAWARYASGAEGKMDLLLQRYADGWRVPHTDEMMAGVIASLDPLTGERRAKAK